MFSGRFAMAAALMATAAVAVGCGSSDDSDGDAGAATKSTSAATVDQAARKLLPEDVTKRGTLRVATTLDWPPFTFKTSGGDPTGVDIDLIGAVAQTLGLKPAITNLASSGWIPGLQNGKFDVSVSQLAISPERRQAVGFVEYIGNPIGLMVRKADVDKIDPTDLCGHTLVGTDGTGPLSFGRAYSKRECVAKGKPPIKFQVYTDSGTTILALVNGRGEGFLVDGAVGAYTAKTTNKNLIMDSGVVPGSITTSGIAFPKQQPEIGKAVQAALLALEKSGKYREILDKWGIANEALPADKLTITAETA